MKIPKKIITEMLKKEKYQKQLKILVSNFLIDKELEREEKLRQQELCKECGKKLKKRSNKGRLCYECYRKYQKELYINKIWKDVGGKPESYLTHKGVSSGDMNQTNCIGIFKTVVTKQQIDKPPYKVIGKKFTIYHARDKKFPYRVQVYSFKYNQEKWFKFKVYEHTEFFIKRMRTTGWNNI